MLQFTPNASFFASSAGYKFYAQTGGNTCNNDDVVLDGAGGWGILKPPLIQRRLTTWWWQCWFYACLLPIDLWVRGNRKQSASPILNSIGCDPSWSLGIDLLEGMWSREGGKGEKAIDLCRLNRWMGCRVCAFGGGWGCVMRDGVFANVPGMTFAHHSQLYKSSAIALKCLRVVCSRLMYCDLTPAFIKH